jgi:hypothetical protein
MTTAALAFAGVAMLINVTPARTRCSLPEHP